MCETFGGKRIPAGAQDNGQCAPKEESMLQPQLTAG